MASIESEFHSILSSFEKHDVLKFLVLIGSWTLKIYGENFKIKHFPFKTTDIDFSIKGPRLKERKATPSIHEILIEKGYIPEFGLLSKSEKYIPGPDFTENQLNVDFLCEYGRHIQDPFTIQGLGVKVTPLSYQRILLDNIVSLKYQGISINVPTPEFWAAHKIAISQIRSGANAGIKMVKDIEAATIIIEFSGETEIIKAANNYPGKFKKLFEKGWKVYEEKFKRILPYNGQ